MNLYWLLKNTFFSYHVSLFSIDGEEINNIFNKTIIHNSKLYIPTGAIKQFSPGFNRNIKHKIRTRNRLRHQPPTPDIINRIHTLNREIHDDIRHEQQTTWKHLLRETQVVPLKQQCIWEAFNWPSNTPLTPRQNRENVRHTPQQPDSIQPN